MTVENGPTPRLPLTMHCSISLGGIPAQANRMGSQAKGQLARAISEQVTRVLCGRFSSPADVVSSSADLMAMGFSPGPKVGEILRALETAQLEGEVRTRDEAITWVSARFL